MEVGGAGLRAGLELVIRTPSEFYFLFLPHISLFFSFNFKIGEDVKSHNRWLQPKC